MELLTRKVAVVEDNRTRADLYALWLDDCEVTVALTQRQMDSIFDEPLAVVVLDRGFGDDVAVDVVASIQARMPACQMIGIRERSEGFPDLPPEQQLVRPVFEEDLQALAERLVYRANYHHALRLYYQSTSNLIYHDVNDNAERDEERRERLRERADRLKALIGSLRVAMDDADVQAVKRAVTFEGEYERDDSTEKVDSKYRPDRCSRCRTDWTQDVVVQLGANIWRCDACGHVQMNTDASHRGIGSYRL